MIDHHDHGAQVCVIGRTRFDTGIGAFSHAACELFSRHAPTCIIPTDRAPGELHDAVLPSGRRIPVCTDVSNVAIFFYADVLFNGAHDFNLSRMPAHGLHIAHFCFDSDQLPNEWVYRLNQHFELAYVPTESQRELAIRSGVRIPVGVLPIGLPIEPLLARAPRRSGAVLRFGTVTAFHERKELETLVRAFRIAFEGRTDVELTIHSNLAFGDVRDRVVELASETSSPAVHVDHSELSAAEKDSLLASFDVFVNCSRGEGYSIGAREALATGACLVLSDVGVHRDIGEVDGIFLAEATEWVPARYPEIDHRVVGRQRRVTPTTLAAALREAATYAASPAAAETVAARRRCAARSSFTDLSIEYAALIDPDPSMGRLGRAAARSEAARQPAGQPEIVRAAWHAAPAPRWKDRVVVQAHDGGFYSVFNVYMSHLAWSLQDDRCHMVLPDWDQRRLFDRGDDLTRESFCYGRLDDGNIWTHLFEPVFGATRAQLDDVEFLYARATLPETHFNERREPMLTYYHAYDLYRSPDFARFRRQYHEAYRRHVHLLPDVQHDIDRFLDTTVGSRCLLAAHVKHPSHVIEQPGALMAAQDAYFGFIDRYLDERGIRHDGDDWRLFLGTDQGAVIDDFHRRYGDHVIAFPDIRRTTATEDQQFSEAVGDNRAQAGFQVQNLVAASPEQWSTDMARDILRDSNAMARAEVLFHVVSNVATAISYMNPHLRMQFVAPDDASTS